MIQADTGSTTGSADWTHTPQTSTVVRPCPVVSFRPSGANCDQISASSSASATFFWRCFSASSSLSIAVSEDDSTII